MSPSAPERWQRLKHLFEQAVEASPADRDAILQRECSDDQELRAEVGRLLRIHDQSRLALDQPPGIVAKVGQGLAETAGTIAASQALYPGQRLAGRFEIVRLAGTGGMGEVYEALDLQLSTRIAIKTIRPDIAEDPKVVSRFKREIGLSRLVTHRNVCRVFEFIEAPSPSSGSPVRFLTMEFLEGETLANYLRREAPIPLSTATPLIQQMASALDAAHQAGIIHRDFKSSNVFLASERVGGIRTVVTDFGLARSYDRDHGLSISTAGGWGAGTPAYMAPEQVEGKAVTAASDVYALGVVMYEMATGTAPYTGDSPMQIAIRRIKERPRAPRTVNAKVDARWDALIMRCLEQDPADRPGSAADIMDALHSRSVFAGVRRGAARRAMLAVAVLLACIVAGWYLRSAWSTSQAPPAQAEAWYREGLNALYDGNLATAQRALQKVIEVAPTWAEGHARLAQVQDEMDQPDLARQSMLQAVHVRRAFFSPLIVSAIQALIVRDFKAACPAFQKIAASERGAAKQNATMDWARCLAQADKASDAVKAVDQALGLNPDLPSANLMRASLGIRLNDKPDAVRARFDKAIDGFRTLNRREALAEGELQLSQWLFKQKDLPNAREAARASLASARSAESKYTEARVLFHLARMADSAAEREEAQQTIQSAVRLAREGSFGSLIAQGLIEQGIQLFTQGKIELALVQFREALEESARARSPRNRARALVWQGDALARLNRFEEAGESYVQGEHVHRANQFPRETLRARLGLAVILRRQGKRAESLAAFEFVQREAQALDDRDLTEDATVRLADFHSAFGEFVTALRYYREWNTLSESTGIIEDVCTSAAIIVRTLTKLGQFAEARRNLKALAADSRCQQPHHLTDRGFTEALLLTEENRLPEALALYRAMLAKAEAAQQSRLVLRIRTNICLTSILAGARENLATDCGDRFRTIPDSTPARASQYNAADMFLKAGDYSEARKRAEIARSANAELGNHDDTYYSLLIRGQAEKRSGDTVQLAITVKECQMLRQGFVDRWGSAMAESYFQRPLYGLRWREISH